LKLESEKKYKRMRRISEVSLSMIAQCDDRILSKERWECLATAARANGRSQRLASPQQQQNRKTTRACCVRYVSLQKIV